MIIEIAGKKFEDYSFYNSCGIDPQLLEKAADGDAKSQWKVGDFLEYDAPPNDKNIDEAVKWYEISAKAGCKQGQYALGESYKHRYVRRKTYDISDDRFIEESFYNAIYWFREAADDPDGADALHRLGICFTYGYPKGGETFGIDPEEAKRCFEKAVYKKDPYAMVSLALLLIKPESNEEQKWENILQKNGIPLTPKSKMDFTYNRENFNKACRLINNLKDDNLVDKLDETYIEDLKTIEEIIDYATDILGKYLSMEDYIKALYIEPEQSQNDPFAMVKMYMHPDSDEEDIWNEALVNGGTTPTEKNRMELTFKENKLKRSLQSIDQALESGKLDKTYADIGDNLFKIVTAQLKTAREWHYDLKSYAEYVVSCNRKRIEQLVNVIGEYGETAQEIRNLDGERNRLIELQQFFTNRIEKAMPIDDYPGDYSYSDEYSGVSYSQNKPEKVSLRYDKWKVRRIALIFEVVSLFLLLTIAQYDEKLSISFISCVGAAFFQSLCFLAVYYCRKLISRVGAAIIPIMFSVAYLTGGVIGAIISLCNLIGVITALIFPRD